MNVGGCFVPAGHRGGVLFLEISYSEHLTEFCLCLQGTAEVKAKSAGKGFLRDMEAVGQPASQPAPDIDFRLD